VVKELIKNDVIVLTTGCNGIACAMEGLLTPESPPVHCGPGLAEVCETVGIPPVLHLGSCVDNSRILLAATEVVKAGGLGKDICDLPAAGSRPRMDERKSHQHRPLFRHLRCLHGLRPAPADLRRTGVP
jgi:carbon-monoxide dehydrogenase catalytic subunit